MDKITVLRSHYNLSDNIDLLEGVDNILDKVHQQALKEVKRETVEITDEEIDKRALDKGGYYYGDSSFYNGFVAAFEYIKSRINQ